VGQYANAKRHGTGTFTDNEGGKMMSFFETGKPKGEGVRAPPIALARALEMCT
jgi:hypothetical protein